MEALWSNQVARSRGWFSTNMSVMATNHGTRLWRTGKYLPSSRITSDPYRACRPHVVRDRDFLDAGSRSAGACHQREKVGRISLKTVNGTATL